MIQVCHGSAAKNPGTQQESRAGIAGGELEVENFNPELTIQAQLTTCSARQGGASCMIQVCYGSAAKNPLAPNSPKLLDVVRTEQQRPYIWWDGRL